MTAASVTELVCRDATAEDVAAIVRLFAAADRAKADDEMQWHYLDNPAGPALVGLAIREDGELAASYAIMPVRFREGDADVLGYQSFDTMTHPDNRGQGLFKRLAQQTYAEAEGRDARLVYGFPNSSSGPGFFTKLQWERHGDYPLLARVLRPTQVARRFLPTGSGASRPPAPARTRGTTMVGRGATVTTPAVTPPGVDALWQAVRPEDGIGLVRDHRYLAWRLDHPAVAGRYQRFAVHDRAGTLVGYAATTHADKHGLRVGYVVELLASTASARQVVRREALRDLRRQGADVVFALAATSSQERRDLQRAGFLPIPARIRPVDLHFGSRAFGAGPLPSTWHLSYVDADTV